MIPPECLIDAYGQGFFPMADPSTGALEWYRPDPRSIIELDGLHISRSLARTLRRGELSVTTDTCFERVLKSCAEPGPEREETWLDHRIAKACQALHHAGMAHSIEAWRDDNLVGGLYGIRIGGAFFGESMFSRPADGGTDASKVCLVWLVSHLQQIGGTLLDVQFMTPHLQRLGAIEISDSAYQARLQTAIGASVRWDVPLQDPSRT